MNRNTNLGQGMQCRRRVEFKHTGMARRQAHLKYNSCSDTWHYLDYSASNAHMMRSSICKVHIIMKGQLYFSSPSSFLWWFILHSLVEHLLSLIAQVTAFSSETMLPNLKLCWPRLPKMLLQTLVIHVVYNWCRNRMLIYSPVAVILLLFLASYRSA